MEIVKQIIRKGEELLARRSEKKFNKEIIVNAEALENRVAIMESGMLEEFTIERTSEKQIVASIFKGKIKNLEPGLKAAFVDIGFEKNAFLHYWDIIPESLDQRVDLIETPKGQQQKPQKKISQNDIPRLYPPGTEVIVQVVKGPIGTKGPRITTNISIPGRFLVLMPYNPQRGISRKIENDKERRRIKDIVANLSIPEGMGVIVRTVGENQKKRYFIRDLEILLRTWKQVEEKIKAQPAPSCVFQEPDLIERTVRDFLTEEVDRILVDHEPSFERIRDMIGQISRLSRGRVRLYTEPTPIFARFNVEKQIENAFRRQVWLKSGGYICFDETEALVAIDVNTGRHKSQKDLETTIVQTNLEAAEEICRQMRLRNIGGLLVIDFIDMRSRGDQQKVLNKVRDGVKRDKAKTRILPISQLGLMEMTRQRHSESMVSSVYEDCPNCKGKGMVKSSLSMSVEIQRKISEVLRRLKEQGRQDQPHIRIYVHPDVLNRLRTEDEALLIELEKKLAGKLSFRADPTFHFEQFKITDAITSQDSRMNQIKLTKLLDDVRAGKQPVSAAIRQLKSLNIHDLDFARVDGHRTLRKGFPEVIYCEGKTPTQVAKIAGAILKHNDNLLATRAGKETYRAVKRAFPKAKYHEAARCITVERKPASPRPGIIAVLCAGTTDIPVAEEAVVTAEIMGNRVKRYYDVGVAGIHRLLAVNHELLDANVLIVVAGMEGALPSVVGGLVDKPVIAVPTSVGYGASFGGIAALLAMLNSCASGVTVVNINNGFGAGYAASLINQLNQRSVVT